MIERADDPSDGLRRHGDIAGGGVDTAVSEQHLDGAGVIAVFQQVGGEAVAERMGRDAFGDSGQVGCVVADFPDAGCLQVGSLLGAGKEPFHGPLHFIVLAQQGQRAGTEDGIAVFAVFAGFDSNEHALWAAFSATASEMRSPEP